MTSANPRDVIRWSFFSLPGRNQPLLSRLSPTSANSLSLSFSHFFSFFTSLSSSFLTPSLPFLIIIIHLFLEKSSSAPSAIASSHKDIAPEFRIYNDNNSDDATPTAVSGCTPTFPHHKKVETIRDNIIPSRIEDRRRSENRPLESQPKTLTLDSSGKSLKNLLNADFKNYFSLSLFENRTWI